MKLLYAVFRHNPTIQSGDIGADHQFLNAFKGLGLDVRVVGPFTQPVSLPEKFVKKTYQRLSSGRYLKYDLSNTLRASREVTHVAREWKPDLLFSLYPAPFVFYQGTSPYIFRTDATFLAAQDQSFEYQNYGKLAFQMNLWMEKRVIRQSIKVITHSQWTFQSLVNAYKVSPGKIAIFPNPASLPEQCIPSEIDVIADKKFNGCLRLLIIGREARRKGLDIALEIVKQLNTNGMPTVLVVCGLNGEDQDYVKYVGILDKSDNQQLSKYISLLRDAHLLLHPARFDPSPRITSEAAAFGTPTITNDVGGLATSVKNNVSGIVLPKDSQPLEYVDAIFGLFKHVERYYGLCRSSRDRFEQELNWNFAGSYLEKLLEEVGFQNA